MGVDRRHVARPLGRGSCLPCAPSHSRSIAHLECMPASKSTSAEARAIEHIKARATELGIPTAVHDDLVEYITGLTRNAWLRGKETGWKNAWNWKQRRGALNASPSGNTQTTIAAP